MPDAAERIVRSIRVNAERAAAAAVAGLYASHPEIQDRFGEQGWEACRAAALTHIDVVCAAIELGRDEPFEQYACWLAAWAESRRIPRAWIDEAFRRLAEHLAADLGEPGRGRVAAVFAAGCAALEARGPDREYPCSAVAPLRGAEALAQALVKGDLGTAQGFPHRLGPDGSGFTELCVRLIQPAMYEVGRWWQEGRISVAEEHLASGISARILDQALACARTTVPVHRAALFACVEGNSHALGLRMVAHAFELSGWSTQYLGADIPSSALVAQVDAWRPDLVGLSASMPQHLPALKAVIGRLRHELASGCPVIMVGGIAINTLGDVWRAVGADVTASDAQAAVADLPARGGPKPAPVRYPGVRQASASPASEPKKMARCAQDHPRYLEAKPSGSRSEIR